MEVRSADIRTDPAKSTAHAQTDQETGSAQSGENMNLQIPSEILTRIHAHGEAAYPEEGAGLLLGITQEGVKQVRAIIPLKNSREDSARHNRYLVTARDYMAAEDEADRQGLEVLGVFHSHPDHPSQPSEYDREWAMPWFSYLITSVNHGIASGSRSWRLSDDHAQFMQEHLEVIPAEPVITKRTQP
jgi:proteasome lid subunit RPN8/RPN11